MEDAEVYKKALELMSYSWALTHTNAVDENNPDIIAGVAMGINNSFVNRARIEIEKGVK